jgi:hypothetical protein
MSASRRLATVAVALSALVPFAAHAMDDFIAPSSGAPMVLKLCGNGSDDPITPAACKEAGYDKQVAQIDKPFNAAVSKAPPTIKPLLKRDQAWFNDIMLNAAQSVPQSDDFDEKEGFGETLDQRAAALQGIAAGFGRPGNDAFAIKRSGEHAVDEMKCKRSPSNSSTARLFPARPSPDINDFGSSIR